MISMWSKCGGSHRRSESVPPRFGVWARPCEGTRAAPARVRPPRVRAVRRVIIRERLLYRSSQGARDAEDAAARARLLEADICRRLSVMGRLPRRARSLAGRASHRRDPGEVAG